MGKPKLTRNFRSEAELIDSAGQLARGLKSSGVRPLVMALAGELGSGKTTWARATLRGLGYEGRVPSPTYTLLQQYSIGELTVVHLDLYRLTGDAEIENLGLRDWLADPDTWVMFEWPERAPGLATRSDLVLEFAHTGDDARRVTICAATAAGILALEQSRQAGFNNDV